MFVGRQYEINILRDLASQTSPSVAVIYGRRRVGKTALIREAYSKEKIIFFEGLEDQGQKAQIANFLFQLNQQASIKMPEKTPASWRECFALLTPILKKEKYVIVFDEFQWMANYRHTLVSDLKMIWDQYWSHTKIQGLILCGSIASFMIRNVIQSKAFYGRIHKIIHLKELSPSEVRQFYPRKGLDEILLSIMHLGGVPLYQRMLNEHLSLSDALDALCFKPNGYFVGEYQRIFLSHFGKSQHFTRIIETLNEFPHGLPRLELAKHIEIQAGGTLSAMLDDLESSGFISYHVPFDKTNDARLRKYQLSDPYLNFYFSFVRPHLNRLSHHRTKIFQQLSGTPAYLSWLGFAFERFCIKNEAMLAKIMGFEGVDYRVGPYFRNKTKNIPGMQIDLLFDRGDQTIIVCEMKYSRSPIKLSVVKEAEKKIELLRSGTRKTILPVLVTNNVASRELLKSGYFYRIIHSDEFFSR